jgi:hypothetical protein
MLRDAFSPRMRRSLSGTLDKAVHPKTKLGRVGLLRREECEENATGYTNRAAERTATNLHNSADRARPHGVQNEHYFVKSSQQVVFCETFALCKSKVHIMSREPTNRNVGIFEVVA